MKHPPIIKDYPNNAIYIDGIAYVLRFNRGSYSIHGNGFDDYGFSTDLAATRAAVKDWKRRNAKLHKI